MLPPEWIFQEPSEDFGIDGIVSIGDEKHITGFEFGVQVKTSRQWNVQDEELIVPGIPRDVLWFWAVRLTPTLLVAYDANGGAGYFVWLPEILTDSLLSESTATVSLRIPISQQLTPDLWPVIKQQLLNYHLKLASALSAAQVLRPLLRTVHSLSQSLRILDISRMATPKTNDETMLLQLSQALAHREVVVALGALAERIGLTTPLGSTLVKPSSAYRSVCAEIFHPFESFVTADPKTPVAVWVNDQKMTELRPKLVALVIDTIASLSAMGAGTASTNNALHTDAAEPHR